MKIFLIITTSLLLLVSCNTTKNKNTKTLYQKYNYTMIKNQEVKFNINSIKVSDIDGVHLKKGNVILFITTDGNYGKMEIVTINPEENYKILFNSVLYNSDGSIRHTLNNYGLKGTFTYDFDKNTHEAIRSDTDIWLEVEDEYNSYLVPENVTMTYLIPN